MSSNLILIKVWITVTYALLIAYAVSLLLQPAQRAVDITCTASMTRTYLCVYMFSVKLFADVKLNNEGKSVIFIIMIDIYNYSKEFINVIW